MVANPFKLTAVRNNLSYSSNALAFAFYVAALFLMLWQTAFSMIALWTSSSGAFHGFFAAPASIWMITRLRRPTTHADTWPLIGVGILVMGVIWLVGEAANANILKHFTFVSLIILGVAMFFGRDRAREWLLPLMLLFLMTPVSDILSPALQTIAANGCVILLNSIGIDATLAGAYITTPAGPFLVAEACSGINFLFAAILVASIIAWRMTTGPFQQAIFIASAALMAIIANIFRATIIILLDNIADGRFSISADHVWLGWVLYFLILISFVTISARLFKPTEPTYGDCDKNNIRTLAPHLRLLVVSTAWIGVIALYANYITSKPPAQEITSDLAVIHADGWLSTILVSMTPHKRFPDADGQAEALYLRENAAAILSIGYYTHDRAGAEIGGHIYDGHGRDWRKADREKNVFQINGKTLTLSTESVITKAGDVQHMTTLYWLGTELYPDRTRLKLALARKKLLGKSPSGGAIVITTPAEQETTHLARLLRDLEPLELWLSRFETRITP